MRTKEELAKALSARRATDMLLESTWSDLVSAIGSVSSKNKDELVSLIIKKQSKKLAVFLYKLLENNAKDRAKTRVEGILADDNISISELDELIK